MGNSIDTARKCVFGITKQDIESDPQFASICDLTSFVTNSSEILTINWSLTPVEVSFLCSLLGPRAEISNLAIQNQLPFGTGAKLGLSISASTTLLTLSLENMYYLYGETVSELSHTVATVANSTLEQLTLVDIPLCGGESGYESFGKFSALRSLTIQVNRSSNWTIPLLASWVQKLRALESLNIQGLAFTSSDTETLAAALRSLPVLSDLTICMAELKSGRPIGGLIALGRLRRLDLHGGCLGNKEVAEMVDVVLSPDRYRTCGLQALRLSFNHIDPAGRAKVAELIQRSPHLKTLDLSNNPIIEIFQGSSAATAQLLEELDVSNCELYPGEIQAMFGTPRAFPALRVLRIGGNDLGDMSAKPIAQFLRASGGRTLTDLWVEYNNITKAGALTLAGAFAKAYRLRTIDMAKNPIDPSGASAILDALVSASTFPMDTIQLEDCGIGDPGAEAAGRLIARRGCRVVGVRNNQVHAIGVKAIADSVAAASECAVQDLDLAGNPLGGEGVRYLLDKMILMRQQRRSRVVRKLNILDTNMGVEGTMAVRRAVGTHGAALGQLFVSNRTEDEEADKILEGVQTWGCNVKVVGTDILSFW